MQLLADIIHYLIPAGIPAALFCAQMIFAIAGATARLIMDVSKRDPKSKRSPEPFNFVFFVKDNALRFIAGFIIMYGGVFFIDLFIPATTDTMLRLLAAAVVGAFGDLVWRAFEKFARGKIKALTNSKG